MSESEQQFTELTPAELLAVQNPADNFQPPIVPGTILDAIVRLLDQLAVREFDGHFVIDGAAVAAKGKTATVNGQIVPAGVGEVVEFTLAVSS